ncbi:hypothetical protein D0962_02810 [Leptolyngbyaceae cyanobacterium CCMR0082]|uniref:Uncharacterized protein n=2 Tax=Adonisia TaxID=2950183 RepID=A0A6M0RZT4_9CYAN|nr:hypothetical protein [Adonisia turfae CCMR0082]
MYQLLELVHFILLHIMQWLQPYLGPICFVLAWSVVILGLWQMIAATRDSVQRAQTMHRIPCPDCAFFTNQAVLKCSLHPTTALSEDAIDCSDYEASNPTVAAYQRLKTSD